MLTESTQNVYGRRIKESEKNRNKFGQKKKFEKFAETRPKEV